MLNSLLPAPKNQYSFQQEEDDDDGALGAALGAPVAPKKVIPGYLRRKGYVPIEQEDFGDGGAFPEIHVVQYPLNMGKPGVRSTAVVAVNVDEKGQVQYDAIVKQGTNRNKIVRTSLDDMKQKDADVDATLLPEEKDEIEAAERTKKALESILEGKISSSIPSTAAQSNDNEKEPTYIRYTPDPNAPGYNAGAKQRVIRMVEAQVDPMEPPKHKHKNVPRGPPSPPVPVLHSPPRKLTVQDQQAWKIPPCISNWKNARGYTIPLDKRLAADGRGLQEVTINSKFAMLSEALYISERKAQEDLNVRKDLRKQMAMKEKEDREKELRDMALQARMDRAGVSGLERDVDDIDIDARVPDPTDPIDAIYGAGAVQRQQQQEIERRAGADSDSDDGGYRGRARRSPSRSPQSRDRAESIDSRSPSPRRSSPGRRSPYGRSPERGRRDSRDSARRYDSRDRGRRERDDSRERHDHSRSSRRGRDDSASPTRRRGDDERDEGRSSREEYQYGETEDDRVARQNREKLRVERRKERERQLRLDNMKGNMRKNKVDRDQGRDVSEKIALGVHRGTGQLTGEALYDSRLFNQSAGMDSGHHKEDDYAVYSKPLFDRGEAASVYRPKQDDSEMYGDADAQMAKLTDTSRFKADKGFMGTQSASSGGPREAPVQFEKARDREEDPFGIDDIVSKKSRYE